MKLSGFINIYIESTYIVENCISGNFKMLVVSFEPLFEQSSVMEGHKKKSIT